MARLVGLPDSVEELVHRYKSAPEYPQARLGQWAWNTYGVVGVDGAGWPELFYADNEKALAIIRNYYGKE